MLKILKIEQDSIGEELGLEKGDLVTHFNDKKVEDILDYIYYDSQEFFVLTICRGEEIIDYEIEKFDYETLGLIFSEELKTITCKNNCLFCFVHQNPKGLRKTLYVKDDDWRESLIHGNYVTLTNINVKAMQRIIDYKMSPLYISVHATDNKVRDKMLCNNGGYNIIEQLKKLSDSNILINCQIVLCKGINDGEVLRQSLKDLKEIENVLSVAIVPVGLTKYRDKLYPLELIDKDTAIKTIEIADEFNGEKEIFCADEIYLKAELPFKGFEEYGSFSQIEDGVGLIVNFEYEFYSGNIYKDKLDKKVTLVTGYSSYDCISKACNHLKSKVKGLEINLKKIKNNFYGDSITVTGLITGGDVISQLKDEEIGEYIVIPKVMLREFENVFLDNVTIKELEEKLNTKVVISDCTGQGFIDAIIGEENE